ncbi:PWWP domain-containing protein [Hirsutella rhossiliensis]|uniref:PWWP domain-containing protein n=1 Tax=Hirsutella rhossiliensis TaxID=111463 RepID=A0A9P8SDJ3_9HYPO|nr:PWWP domain-containing protein [Hirsutella rhossiliensis]KAH0957410.1 PWWP domain-containing protein [Hirsutella rhossiliensis]
MADKPNEKAEAAAPVAEAEQASTPDAQPDEQESGAKDTPKPDDAEGAKENATNSEESGAPDNGEEATEDATDEPAKGPEKPAADADVEMKNAPEDAAPEAEPAAAAAQTPASKAKSSRRKSGAGESKGKALNKKGSKARLTHIDAQPGDHFLVKLKGFPAWPAIICDETMLPAALIGSRPVSAARPDGSYSEAYADGGKRVHDRSFPVMYLYTNEFGWVQNTALSELSADKAKDTITEKMRKDLKAAFELAAEHHAVDHYKQILKSFQEEQIAQEEARKQAAATPKKSKKGKGKATDDDEAADVEDADLAPKSAMSKKRKAEEDTSTPQRPDSVKKPKIKLNTSSTPKTVKPKKAKEGGEKKVETPKEAKMTPEERRARKEKEVLYLRHKLQRGLLTREQQPREDEMKSMSDYISVLENFVDLEVSIIRATKINKVLKAILKLESVPREEEFEFKKRSQALLDKWNKLLAGDASGPPSATTNGVNGAGEEKKSEANGVKDGAEETTKDEPEKAPQPKTEETVADEGGAEKSGAAEEKEEKSGAAEGTAPEVVAAED